MTPYERYRAMLEGKETDILPRLPILMAFAAHHIGTTYDVFASDYRVLAEANLRCAEAFDFDQISAISDPYRETQGFGGEVSFPHDQVPRCMAPPLAENPDLEALPHPAPMESERMRDRILGVELMRNECGDHYSVLGWIEGPAAEAADLREISNFLMDTVMNESYAADLMDRCVSVGIDFARAQIKAGADTIGMGDAVASQVSPQTYESLIFPREKKVVDAIHDADGLARLHICGDTTHLLPYIAQLGCDVVDLDWQVDLAHARNVLGAEQCIAMNLDPVKAVLDSTPEAIRAAMEEQYAMAGNPIMVGAGCEIPPGTPEENLRALCAPMAWKGNA
jgi:MtaA/CmuA family methyltransferase